jgi:ubiquinone/menaquinone biosynthesis C-methylase UbiE
MDIIGNKDTINWYNDNADKYAADTDDITFEATARNFLERLVPNPKILDAGCGSGRDSATLSELSAEVTGIDLSKGLIEVAKKKRPGITFIEGSFLNIPFPNETFDGIWSHASLVHLDTIKDVRIALNEFNRVLKPNGQLYILVKKQSGEEKTAVVSDSLSNHDRFFRYYTEDELTALLEESGYMLEEIATEDDPHGREEVQWIKVFARKIS